jgi:ribosomal-protein-alanine N-acetyltransferase
MAVERRSFTLPWSANTYRHEILENANAHYYVLRRRGEPSGSLSDWLSRLVRREPESPIIGYGGFWMIVDEAHISTIAIDVAWRGRSLGELLLSSMIEQALALNAASITLEVRESNLAAQNLYRKYGFAVTGKRLRYYQDNSESAFLMAAERINTEAYRQQFHLLSEALHAGLDGSSIDGLSVGTG